MSSVFQVPFIRVSIVEPNFAEFVRKGENTSGGVESASFRIIFHPEPQGSSITPRFPPGGRIVKSLLRTLPVFALAVCLVGFVLAEDKKPAEKKLDELKTEYQPKLTELAKKVDAITNTPERKKARDEAKKKAIDDGKKGK